MGRHAFRSAAVSDCLQGHAASRRVHAAGHGADAAVPWVLGRHELGQRLHRPDQPDHVRQRYAPGSGELHDCARRYEAGRQRHRDGGRAPGGHAVWRHAPALSVAAGHSLPEAAFRHHDGRGSEIPADQMAGTRGHGARHRSSGHSHVADHSHRHAHAGAFHGHQVGAGVLRGHAGLLSARLRQCQRQGDLALAPARGQPGRAHELCLAQNRQAVCGDHRRWRTPVAQAR